MRRYALYRVPILVMTVFIFYIIYLFLFFIYLFIIYFCYYYSILYLLWSIRERHCLLYWLYVMITCFTCLYVCLMGRNVSSYFRDVEAGWSPSCYFNLESNILDFYCEGIFFSSLTGSEVVTRGRDVWPLFWEWTFSQRDGDVWLNDKGLTFESSWLAADD